MKINSALIYILVLAPVLLTFSGCAVQNGMGSHSRISGDWKRYENQQLAMVYNLSKERDIDFHDEKPQQKNNSSIKEGKKVASEGTSSRDITFTGPQNAAESSQAPRKIGNNRSKEKKFPLSIQLQDVGLKDLLDTLIVDCLDGSYILDAKSNPRISINLNGNFTRQNIVDALRLTLNSVNLSLVLQAGVYHVIPINKKSVVSSDLHILILSPHFVQVENLMVLLKNFVTAEGKMVTIQGSNILFIQDYPANIEKIKNIVRTFDVPFFANKYARIYTLHHAIVADVAEEFQKLLNEYNLFIVKEPSSVRLIPLPRLNKVVILASTPTALNFFDTWIRILDQENNNPANMSFYHYQPKYVQAKDLQVLLSSIFPKPKRDEHKGFECFVDQKANLLIIKASHDLYQKALDIIADIDKAPTQIYIKAVLAEIVLNDETSLGFNWFVRSGDVTFGSTMGNVTTDTLTLAITAKQFYSVLKLMIKDQDARIVATPHILVKSGESASIEIIDQVPVVKDFLATDVQQEGTTANKPSIEYKDAGVVLKVTPRLAGDNKIDIIVDQELSNAKPVTLVADLQSYEFSTRKVQTHLMLNDQESILIGGLMKNSYLWSRDSVPFLSDIPVIKYLFSARQDKLTRTELVLFLTPYIIRSPDTLKRFSDSVSRAYSRHAISVTNSQSPEPLIQ